MTDRDHVTVSNEQVRLTECYSCLNDLRCACNDEEGITILLDLWALVRLAGIFDGKIVQPKLLPDASQQAGLGSNKPIQTT